VTNGCIRSESHAEIAKGLKKLVRETNEKARKKRAAAKEKRNKAAKDKPV
jgi:hypothetical protein